MNQLPDAVVASRPTATVGCYTVPDSDPLTAMAVVDSKMVDKRYLRRRRLYRDVRI